MTTLDWAIKLRNEGVSVIPIIAGTKRPAVAWTEYRRRLTSPAEITAWDMAGMLKSYGVICGKRHGQPGYLVVIDFDDLEAAARWVADRSPRTLTVLTSRGLHAYYLVSEEIANVKIGATDVKANGYVLGAESLHPSGATYEVFTDAPIAEIASLAEVLPDIPPRPARILSEPALPPVNADPWAAAEIPGYGAVAAIKARVKILDLFPDAQKTEPSGRWWIARCPLHDDQTPSLWIDAARGVCGCFAGCEGGRPMDVINLTARALRMSNREAIGFLCEALKL